MLRYSLHCHCILQKKANFMLLGIKLGACWIHRCQHLPLKQPRGKHFFALPATGALAAITHVALFTSSSAYQPSDTMCMVKRAGCSAVTTPVGVQVSDSQAPLLVVHMSPSNSCTYTLTSQIWCAHDPPVSNRRSHGLSIHLVEKRQKRQSSIAWRCCVGGLKRC